MRIAKSLKSSALGVSSLFTVIVLAASGCGASASSATSSSAAGGHDPVRGGNLTIGFDLNVENCLDPQQDYGLEQRDLDRNLVDSLTDQNPQTGQIVPWLATSWSVNNNSTVFTFDLRKGVTFSNGQPLTAAAVKTSFDGAYKLGALSLLGITYLAGYQGTKVVNPYEVQISFKQPNAQFLQATATTVLGIEAPATYKYTPAQRCLGKFWGSGPFTLKSYTPGVSAVLVRRAGYAWPSEIESNKGPAYLNSITANWITEDSVLVGELDSGELDLAWPRTPLSSANQSLIKGDGGSVFSRPYPGIVDLLMPNVSSGRILSDPIVRQALQESINRAQIASTAYWAGYPVVSSALEDTTPDYTNESSLLAYDPKAAETLLQDDGWKLGAGGIREKDGRQLTLIIPVTESDDPIVDLVQSELKTVGIDLQEKLVTEAEEDSLLEKPGGDYDLIEDYYTRGDPSVLASILDTAIATSPYVTQSQSPSIAKQVASLFAAGDAAIASATRTSVYAQLQTLLIKDGVVFPLDERLEVEGVGKDVHGLEVTDEGLLIANNIWLSKS